MKTYTTEELKEICQDPTDAAILLGEHCPQAARKFKRLTKQLAALLDEIRQTFPDACYYTSSGRLDIVLGFTHDEDLSPNSMLDAVSADTHFTLSDGDW